MVTTNTGLENLVKGIDNLPSLPQAALKIIREAENSEFSIHEMANTIAQDQSMTARVLKLANSAYYGHARRIVDITEAVMMLGTKTVKNLALIASSEAWLSTPLPGYMLGPRELWVHSFSVAVAAQLVAKQSKKVSPEICFTAGLLHDIGKVVLSYYMQANLSRVLTIAEKKQIPFNLAEQEVLGYDHTQVGEYLAEKWNLPKELILSIRYHHHPDAMDEPNLIVDAVHIGIYLTLTMGFGLGADGLNYEFSEDALERLGIEMKDLDMLVDEFIVIREGYEELFKEIQS